ncbi:MAG: O-antigen ligase family protein [Nitrospirota bacterium]
MLIRDSQKSSKVLKIIHGLIYTIIFISPNAQLETNITGLNITGSLSRILGIILAIFFSLHLLISKSQKTFLLKDKYGSNFVFFLFLIMFIPLISFYKALDYELFFQALIKLLMSVAFSVIIFYSISTIQKINTCLLSYLFGYIFIAIIGIYNYNSSEIYTGQSYTISRLGAGTDPNMLALYSLIAMPICLKFFTEAGKLKKLLWLIALLFIGTTSFLTYSRAGIIVFVVQAVLALFIFKVSKSLLKRIGFSIIIILITVIPFYTVENWALRFRDIQSDTRLQLFEEATATLVENPLLGVGYNQFILYSRIGEVAHNTYLEIGAGTGIFSLIVFVSFLLFIWRSLYIKREITHGLEMRFKAMSKLILSTLIIMAFFLSIDNEKILWVNISLIFCILRYFQHTSNPQPGNYRIEKVRN